jgi:hypothetical protein
MPNHITKIRTLLLSTTLATLLIISAPIVYADDSTSSPYAAEIPVANRTPIELNKAFATALQQILEKATATDTPAGKSPEITAIIKKQIPHAASMVQSYSYAKHVSDKGVQQLTVQINFYQESIEHILSQLPGQEHQDAIYANENTATPATKDTTAKSDVIYPITAAANAKANPPPVVSSSDAVTQSGPESPAPTTQIAPANNAITMKINGVNNLEQNMAVVNYLQSLSPKLKAELLDVTTTSITVGITMEDGGDKTTLMNILNTQKNLSKDTSAPAKPVNPPNNANNAGNTIPAQTTNDTDLTYNWTPPPTDLPKQ